MTATAGVADPGWSTSATFTDFDSDGDLDLFFTNYIHWSHAVEMNCYSGSVLTYCPPENYNAPARDRLYRNDGDGTFTDVSAASGISSVFGNGFGVVAADFNADGLSDIFIANDQMVDQLWLNRGGLEFEEVGEPLGLGGGRAWPRQGGHGRRGRGRRPGWRHGRHGHQHHRTDGLVLP